MTATIKGHIKSPTGTPVPVTIKATPNPNPTRTSDGDLIVPGTVTSNGGDEYVAAALTPGRYIVAVSSPAGILAERDVTLTDGTVLTLGDILTPPAPTPGGTPLVDADGRPLVLVDIKVVTSVAQAEALPDGSVYLLIDAPPAPTPGGTPAPTPGGTPTLISHAAGQTIGDAITIRSDGQSGDLTIVAVNTKAIGDQTFTWPEGFQTLVEPYYIGTMRFVVAVGSWAPELTVRTSQPVEAGWVAVTTRGGGNPVAGDVKKRQAEPAETTTCTAPEVPARTGLTIGFAFERTAASETADQVTISEGWERLEYAAQEGSNLQTVTAAHRTAPAGALTVTYPNPQAANGAGVQVVIPNA